jgi:site-specific DNA-cytosine methylase
MPLKNSKRKYKVISLFSGAMGLDIGLEKTGNLRNLLPAWK